MSENISSSPLKVVVGVDVGGTNTDAVVISKGKDEQHQVLSETKHLTTSDVTTGVRNAVLTVLRQAKLKYGDIIVTRVNIGTTHFVNAIVQYKHLSRVSVIRLCGSASRAVPPFADFPARLRDVIMGSTYFVDGGCRVDGREIEVISQEEIKQVVGKIKADKIHSIVVCGIFSPTRTQQEEEVGRLIRDFYPEASLTLSHTIGHIGLLERENAAILNECLKELCKKTVSGFRDALDEIGLRCPIFITQNDGTVLSAQQALDAPVFTLASGPTNSMRGAAFLCNVSDAIVVDIGGTSTDVGVLKMRFPREASSDVRVCGVRTNFRMPDVHSVGLGGGSYVNKNSKGEMDVGPLSAGFNLMNEALVFGSESTNHNPDSGRWLTATDIAVAAGLMDLGDRSLVQHIPQKDIKSALQRIHTIVENAIDSVRISDDPLPVVLVGGGSRLLDPKLSLRGTTTILLPEHYGVANAIGAALSQVSGNIDSVVVLERLIDLPVMEQKVEEAKQKLGPAPTQHQIDEAVRIARKSFIQTARDLAMQQMCDKARQAAINSGASASSVKIVDQEEIALSYLPGYATRIKIKAVGDLAESQLDNVTPTEQWSEPSNLSDVILTPEISGSQQTKQITSVTGHHIVQNSDESVSGTWLELTPTQPYIDDVSGEWVLNEWDIECITIGAGILGAGGGGNPNIGRVRAREAIRQGKKMRILAPERLATQCDVEFDLLATVAYMGAPVVLYEQTTSGQETPEALRCLQELYSIGGYTDSHLQNLDGADIKEKDDVVYIDNYQPQRQSGGGDSSPSSKEIGKGRVVAVLCAEVGGMNSLEPLLVSAMLDLPALDADGMGRAFPMVQMFLPFINGRKPYPSTLADDKGRRAVVLRCQTARQLEDHFRQTSMDMGSAAGLAIAPITMADVMESTVLRSFSRVWKIGDSILRARKQKENPFNALLKIEPAKVIVVGKIRDVMRETSGAFNRGQVHVEGVADIKGWNQMDGGTAEHLNVILDFQNENLVVRKVDENGELMEILAVVPDIISIMDSETAEPIPTEEVRYGQRVAVVVLPSPPRMATPRALEFVGPIPFGYLDVTYVPVGDYKEPVPIAPL